MKFKGGRDRSNVQVNLSSSAQVPTSFGRGHSVSFDIFSQEVKKKVYEQNVKLLTTVSGLTKQCCNNVW